MGHEVFISHSSRDKAIADSILSRLEAGGIRCWMAPRDIIPGLPYGEAVLEAIEASRLMVLVISSSSGKSRWVRSEVERAANKDLIILPFRIESIAMPRSLEFYISECQWQDATTPPLAKHLDSLASTIRQHLPGGQGRRTEPAKERNEDSSVMALPARRPVEAAPKPARPPVKPAMTWDIEILRKVHRRLVSIIGPVAKAHVVEAAKRARSVGELYQILAETIPWEDDRQKFLDSRPD